MQVGIVSVEAQNQKEQLCLVNWSHFQETVWEKALSAKKVLSVFFYLLKIEKVTITESSKEVTNMCISFREKARIITGTKIHARKREEKLFLRWKEFRKAA